MTDTPGPLAAALAAIREDVSAADALAARMKSGGGVRVAEFNAAQDRLARHVPALLKAVEAVLALHRPDGYSLAVRPCEHHSVTRTDLAAADLAAAQRACPDCRVTEYARCWQHGCPGPWPCPTYSALAAELLTKEKDDA